MKRIINKIARYIVGVWGLLIVFLLSCMLCEDNVIADRMVMPAFVLFLCATVVLLVTYVIHFAWMIQEKKKPENLRADILYALALMIALTAYDVYANRSIWNDIWEKIIFVSMIIIFSKIGKYIYSWRE